MKNSICIEGSRIVVCYPEYNVEGILEVSDLKLYEGHYNVDHDAICYVCRKKVFVAPFSKRAVDILKTYGFTEWYFRVPFGNCYPKDEKEKWLRLKAKAHDETVKDYEDSCYEFCRKRGIGELSEETMHCCIRIPHEGIMIKKYDQLSRVFPLCEETHLDFAAKEKLGRYNTHDDTVVFVYRDGHTYVTIGTWIINELMNAGYSSGDLLVPFCDGEVVEDPEVKLSFDRVIKNMEFCREDN